MALRRRGGQGEGMNVWPGYVDALSTLLMVIIFVLLVFVLAQAFLSVTLSGRDQALNRLNQQLAELSDMLALERGRSADLRGAVAQKGRDLQVAVAARDGLTQQLAASRAELNRLASDHDALKSDRDRLAARVADADLQAQGSRARTEQLQAQLADAAKTNDAAAHAAAQTDAQLAEARRQLADMQRQMAEQDRVVQADKATIAAKLSDLASLTQQVRDLTALRDQLRAEALEARAAAEAQLAEQTSLAQSAQAHVVALTQQLQDLRDQIAAVSHALDLAQDAGKGKDAKIAELNGKLNTAMAQRLEELQRYRSDFFGKLRSVLSNRPGIQVVGDRFVFQSEVLFPVGSAELTAAGQEQINQLATTLKDIGREIPSGVNWLLRVDGHADRQPISGGAYSSNWELSAGRAITVVKRLIADGIPADRVAAAGFADYQPLDPGDTADAYAKNRRIEIRLTDR